MLRSRFQLQSGVQSVGSVFVCVWLVASCSLRDTSSLDSGSTAGHAGVGSLGTGGDESSGGSGDSAGSSFAGHAAGGRQSQSNAGDAGQAEVGGDESGGTGGIGGFGGTGGMAPVGTFANCPGRPTWKIDSNPTAAQVQMASSLGIALNQLLPQYAIDDDDKSGTTTRFSSARPMVGDEFVSVDMGAERWVNGVYTKEVSATGTDYGRAYEVSVSRDGKAFTVVANHEGMPGAFDINFPPVIARYVRLGQTGMTDTDWWSLHDYKVYCTAETVPTSGAGGSAGSSGSSGGSAGSSSGGTGGAAAGSGGKGGTGGKAGSGGGP